jgi:hypothetical protein
MRILVYEFKETIGPERFLQYFIGEPILDPGEVRCHSGQDKDRHAGGASPHYPH